MTGPEHYREAERLIMEGHEVVRQIRLRREDRDSLGKKAMGIWAQAQVHATLALVASNVDRGYSQMEANEWDTWTEATR